MQPKDIKKLAVIFTVAWVIGSGLLFMFLMFASYANIKYTIGGGYVILNSRLDTMEASKYHAMTLISSIMLTVFIGGFLYAVSWIAIGLMWFTRATDSQTTAPSCHLPPIRRKMESPQLFQNSTER